jgi:hypothetical protein
MKKLIATITAGLLFTCLFTASAHADRKTLEGFMLGTGAVILGSAIINGLNNNSRPRYNGLPAKRYNYQTRHYGYYSNNPYASRQDQPRYGNKKRHQGKYKNGSRGYFAIEKVWIKPVYKKRWNPGHYNRRGEWIDGRKEKFIVQNGYWAKEKTWRRH